MYPKNPVPREYVVNCKALQTKSQVFIANAVVGKTASASGSARFIAVCPECAFAPMS